VLERGATTGCDDALSARKRVSRRPPPSASADSDPAHARNGLVTGLSRPVPRLADGDKSHDDAATVLLTASDNRMVPCANLIGVALVATLGALGIVGCGGSHTASVTTVVPAVGGAQSAASTPNSRTSGTSGATTSARTTTGRRGGSASTRGGATSTHGTSLSAHADPGKTGRHAGAGGGKGHTGLSAGKAGGSGSGAGAGGAPNASTGVPYEVHTTSMEPTYKFGTEVYYDPTRTHPQVGEVVVFYLPVGGTDSACGTVMEGRRACAVAKPGLTSMLAVKRVVGLPGDTIAIREGRVIRNGQPESEPPTIHCGSEPGCEFPEAIAVPAGSYYVMADNRQLYHEDSRLWGAVPQAAIVGTVEGG
jgi:signal peptidase I